MIFTRTFTLAQVAEVVGRNPSTLRTHINRGYVVARGPHKREGDKPAGKHARFSYFTMMQFAVGYALSELSVDLETSFRAAGSFSHFGEGGDVFDLPERLPGLPFHHNHGVTILGVAGERTFEEIYAPGRDTYGNLRRHLGSGGFIALDATEVFLKALRQLDLDGRAVLDEYYPTDAT